MLHLWHCENVQFDIYQRILNSVSHLKQRGHHIITINMKKKTVKTQESFSSSLSACRWNMKASINIIIISLLQLKIKLFTIFTWPQTGYSCIYIPMTEWGVIQCRSANTGNWRVAPTVPVTWIMKANLEHDLGWETSVIWALHWQQRHHVDTTSSAQLNAT